MENIQEKSFEWIKNAIDSSNNPFHIDCCKKLIELYMAKFSDLQREGDLLMRLSDKEQKINYI
jgi:hypothetical protein